jgi:hypothetical protein
MSVRRLTTAPESGEIVPARRETLLAPSPASKVGGISLRGLSALQWVGVLAPGLAWFAQHIVGFGVGQAECSSGGLHWGIDNAVWQLSILAAAALVCVAGEVAAVLVFQRTRGTNFGDGPAEDGRWHGQPPYSRLHFFATAALVANVLFLAVILLDGLGAAIEPLCRQA